MNTENINWIQTTTKNVSNFSLKNFINNEREKKIKFKILKFNQDYILITNYKLKNCSHNVISKDIDNLASKIELEFHFENYEEKKVCELIFTLNAVPLIQLTFQDIDEYIYVITSYDVPNIKKIYN